MFFCALVNATEFPDEDFSTATPPNDGQVQPASTPEKEPDLAESILQAAKAEVEKEKEPVDTLWDTLESEKNKVIPTPAPTPGPLPEAVMPTPAPTPVPPTYKTELNSQTLNIYLKGPWTPPAEDRFLRAFVEFFNLPQTEKIEADPEELDKYIVSPHIAVFVEEKKQSLVIDPSTGKVFSTTLTGVNTNGEMQYTSSLSTRDPSVWSILNNP